MTNQQFMLRAIELARQGEGWTSPNPMVGAVVVKDGAIIGEGYHKRHGEWHAERNALNSCSKDPEGATLYVTLEPCCHYGKTPPCTEIIIEKGISRVFIGSRDPNPLVAGKGAKILREHGIEVIEDYMREECDQLNPVFFHFITTGTPYVVMKYAMTLDGKIATHTGASKWITSETARCHVHKLRNHYRAIMVGIGTVLADNPMLNCRLEGGRNPIRIICDSKLRIPMDSAICQTAKELPTIIACGELNENLQTKKSDLEQLGIKVLSMPSADGTVDLKQLMQWLGNEKIDSVLIEGGGNLHESARASGIVNHVCAYIAPKLFGGCDAKSPIEGIGVFEPKDATLLHNLQITPLGTDLLLEYDVLGGDKTCLPD